MRKSTYGLPYCRVLAVLTAGLLLPQPAYTEVLLSQPWQVLADSITYKNKERRIIANGDVILQPADTASQDPIIIRADSIDYKIDTGEVAARGNLHITTAKDEIRAEEALIQVDSQTGIFKKAELFYAENNLYLTSDSLEKTGPQTYRTQNALLSTCTLPAEGTGQAWSIKSADTTITRDGYAILKHTSFRVLDKPIFYSPFFILPAKTTRQSGFLFPEVSSSKREGLGVLTPYFINLSPSSDLTLYPGYYSKRGILAGTEFRYVADERSKGTFSATFMDDSIVESPGSDYNGDGFFRTRKDRFWVRGKADHYFSNDFVARADIDMVSDRDFLQEFDSALIGFARNNSNFLNNYQRSLQPESVPLRENTLQLSRSWTNMGVYGEMLAINDARNEFINPSPLWSMPRINFSGLTPIPLLEQWGADLSWDTEYVYYWRDRGIGAHRIDLTPRLVLPLQLSPYLEASLDGAVRETFYAVEERAGSTWNQDSSRHRHLFDAGANLGTTLVRDYTITLSEQEHPLRHKVRPYVDYRFRPAKNQDDLPALDKEDRVNAERSIRYGMSSFLSERAQMLGLPLRDYMYLDINQSYDDNRVATRHFSDIQLEVRLTPFDRLQVGYESAYNVYGDGVPYYDLKTNYTTQRGDTVSADYRYKRDQDAHEMHADVRTTLTDKVAARVETIYSFSLDREVESGVDVIYQAACWSLNMTVSKSKNPDDVKIMFVVSLSGIGKALGWGIGNI